MQTAARPERKIENPFGFFAEATDAANQLFRAQREHFELTAGLRAQREVRRVVLIVGAIVLGTAALTLGLFWLGFEAHEAGVPAWAIAAASLVLLGALSMLCANRSKNL
jgi:apolipoprotein N-acyltransferase